MAVLPNPRIAAFSPGLSPPAVRIPMRRCWVLVTGRPSVGWPQCGRRRGAVARARVEWKIRWVTPAPLDLTATAALFDMDGTLVDSHAVVESLWAGFADRYGVDLDALLAYSHGRQTVDTVARFLPGGIDPEPVVAGLEAGGPGRAGGVSGGGGAPARPAG